MRISKQRFRLIFLKFFKQGEMAQIWHDIGVVVFAAMFVNAFLDKSEGFIAGFIGLLLSISCWIMSLFLSKN